MSAERVIDSPCIAEATIEGVSIHGARGQRALLTPRAALATARNLTNAAVDVLMASARSPRPQGAD